MKYKSCLTLLALVVFMAGCGKNGNNEINNDSNTENFSNTQKGKTSQEDSSSDKNSDETSKDAQTVKGNDYNIISKSFKNSDGKKLLYPQINGLNNTDIQNKWNKKIENDALGQNNDEVSLNESTLDYSYEVKTKTKDLISILCKATVYFEGAAHPFSYVNTYNIDLKTGNSKRLADNPNIKKYSEAIFNRKNYKIKTDNNKNNFLEIYNKYALDNDSYESVNEVEKELQNYDYDLKNSNFEPLGFSYYEDNKTVICRDAPHAIGDYVELIMD